ncbi:MAG: serine hydrolase [Lachnospiraceae bacterium]|nr:serine hydrolase [Lachnospiraceae bacterium]
MTGIIDSKERSMPTPSDKNSVAALEKKALIAMDSSPMKADYEPWKTRACEIRTKTGAGLPIVTPESVGVSSLYISDFLKELTGLSCDLHHFLMLRKGKIIAEASFAPYLKGTWHSCHGIAKSITNIAVGILCDEGKLTCETRLTDVFGSKISFLNSLKLKNITIHDLLTMSSGTVFDEEKIFSGNDWAGMFFDAPLHFEPGTRFEYNSLNTYILSAAVTAITKLPMDEFLKTRLFDPLGITSFIWERCPNGITKGGWGLFMYPEDIAKIGMLYLNRGIYSEKRIVSEVWMKRSIACAFSPEGDLPYGYGYHVWTGAKEGDLLFSGIMMQKCFVFSQNEIVIVINAGDRSGLDRRVNDLVNSYFGSVYNPPAFLVENRSSFLSLSSLLSSFEKRNRKIRIKRGGWRTRKPVTKTVLPFDRLCECLNDHSYVLSGSTAGFMPHFLQYIQNNHTSGLKEVSFEKDHRGLVIHLTEGGRTNDLFLSHDRDRYAVMNFKGEIYLVSGIGGFSRDEDDDLCLKVEAAFIEADSKRYLRFFFKDGFERIKIELSETRGTDMSLKEAGLHDITDTVTGYRKDTNEKIGENILWARP